MHYEAAITSQPLTLNRSASRVSFRKKQRFFRKILALQNTLQIIDFHENFRRFFRTFFAKFSHFFRKIFALFSHSKTPYKSSILGKIFDAFFTLFSHFFLIFFALQNTLQIIVFWENFRRFFRKIFAKFSHPKTPYKSSILGKKSTKFSPECLI